MIQIEYDGQILNDAAAQWLAEAVQKVVSEATGVQDIFVYANVSRIRVKAAPIEIFVHLSDYKIKNLDKLTSRIKKGLAEWKQASNFNVPINLSVIPMPWKVEFDI